MQKHDSNMMPYEVKRLVLKGMNTEGLPMWSINHYIQKFCEHYDKVMIIRRICELSHIGISPDRFIVATKSAPIFPSATIKELFTNKAYDYIVLDSGWDSEKAFWHIVTTYKRPMVFYVDDRGCVKPVYDFDQPEAIKITHLSYNSPIEFTPRGAVNIIVDLVEAGARQRREEEAHRAEQVGRALDNYRRLGSAAQTINDPRTPEGIRCYANDAMWRLMREQERLNDKLGIRVERVDDRG